MNYLSKTNDQSTERLWGGKTIGRPNANLLMSRVSASELVV